MYVNVRLSLGVTGEGTLALECKVFQTCNLHLLAVSLKVASIGLLDDMHQKVLF